MRINTNPMAMNGHRNLSAANGALGKNLEKLSSGLRINRAADDAAGLVISESLRSQVGGLKQATRNAQDGISVVQTAEGALTEVHSMLQRVRDLTVQAGNSGSNGGSGGDSVKAIQAEVNELIDAIDAITASTQFNGTKLLDGSQGTVSFQVGANGGERLDVSLTDMSSDAIGSAATTDRLSTLKTGNALTTGNTDAVLTIVDDAIKDVSGFRAELGAKQNRLEHQVSSLQVATENLASSESRIRDVDMASEMASFTRNQIMSQAATSMLSQANSVPQGVLSLLQG